MSKTASVRISLEKTPKALVIAVESVQTGRTLVYSLEAGAWGALGETQKQVIVTLTRTHIPGKAITMDLSYDDMKVFKAMAESQGARAEEVVIGTFILGAKENAEVDRAFAQQEKKAEEKAFASDPDYQQDCRHVKAAEEAKRQYEDEVGENFQEPAQRREVNYRSKSGRMDRYEVVEEFRDRINFGPHKGRMVAFFRLRPLNWTGNPFAVPASRCE